MIPVNVCDTSPVFPSRHLAGDTWSGMTIGPLFSGTGDSAYAPVYIVKMQFKDRDGVLQYTISSEVDSINGQPDGFYDANGDIVRLDTKGSITIWDATNWMIGIDSQLIDVSEGWYQWDVEVVDTLGIARTILKGNLRVIGDITDNILAKANWI